MITLTVTLKGRTPPTGERFDVTRTMDRRAVWDAWRILAGQRKAGEHVMVTVTADGMPKGDWYADHDWPRESANVIARLRRKEPVPQ